MAIQFITNRLQNREFEEPPYPHWGNIAKGVKKTTAQGVEYPAETHEYNFSFNAGFEDLHPIVKGLYGDKPTSLDVIVYPTRPTYDPNRDETIVDVYAPASMQQWVKPKGAEIPKLMTECNSHTVKRIFDPATKRYVRNPDVACDFNPETNKCGRGCKPTMRFFIILPDLCREVNALGYFTLTTHGTDDIADVTSKFLQLGDAIGSQTWRFSRSPKNTVYTDPKDGKTKEGICYPINAKALIQLGAGMNNLLAHLMGGGNQNAPALVQGDVNKDAHYDYDAPPDDYTGYPNNEPIPAPVTTEAPPLGRMLIEYLRANHRDIAEGVQVSDMLFTLGFESLDDLTQNWGSKYPDIVKNVGNVVKEYARIIQTPF